MSTPLPLSKPVLYAKSAPGISPFDGAIDASDLAGATFETTCELDHHLSFFIKRIEVCRAGMNTKTFLAVLTDFLVDRDMGLLVVLKSIQCQFIGNLH
jgi:hypothetical protein